MADEKPKPTKRTFTREFKLEAIALAEKGEKSMKTKLVHAQDYATVREARSDIFDYIEVFYNRERLHSGLDYLSPDAFERAAAPMTS